MDEPSLSSAAAERDEAPLASESSDAEHADTLRRYTIAESGFFDCLSIDQFGRECAPLPPALLPTIGLKFRTFDAKLEAKYGVRNYRREIAGYYEELDKALGAMIPGLVTSRDPLGAAIAIVRMYSEAHVFDVQVRRTKRAARQRVYIRSLEPRVGVSRVIRPDLDDIEDKLGYEDDLVVLAQRELLVGNNAVETMLAVQPLGFTYHAMLRLWDRGRADGQNFHAIMADACGRLRGVTALVELCHIVLGTQVPSQIAVPMLDGFLVASRRQILVETDEWRWGFKRKRRWFGRLNPWDEAYFPEETCHDAKGAKLTNRACWIAATFMGANDIGAWERVAASNRFAALIEGVNLDIAARIREALFLSGLDPGALHTQAGFPDPRKLVALQWEMLPQAENADERWHLLYL